jgi:hypothetical protein
VSTRSLHDRKKAHGAGILAERAAVVILRLTAIELDLG